MSVLQQETQLIASAQGKLPRVNLLPPEIAERAAFRKVQVGLGCGLAATIGIVGLLFVSASHSVSTAQSSLDTQNARAQSLAQQKTQYADVTATYNAAAAAQAELTTAMGQEVRYSQLMHDLSLSVPSTVWLKSLTFTQAGSGASASAGAAAPGPGAIGTVSVTGVGFSHDDLALWLESLASQKNYGNPYFSSSTEGLLGTKKVVNFTSTADLEPSAYSNRYTKPVGE